MRMHAYRRPDGALELFVDGAARSACVTGAHDLGLADVELATFSPDVVLAIGMDARALARGADALLVESALARREAPG